MKIACIQHVPFEEEGTIQSWAHLRNVSLELIRIFKDEPLPDPETLSGIVLLGGSMGVYDEASIPFLKAEKAWLKEALKTDTPILGICLGSQLLAEQLGGHVSSHPQQEIGWLDITLTEACLAHPLFDQMEETMNVFQWHGDRFSIPPQTIPIASSKACESQGFIYKDNVVGLQFHLEMTERTIEHLIEKCAADLAPGPFVQPVDVIRKNTWRTASTHDTLFTLLDRLFLKK